MKFSKFLPAFIMLLVLTSFGLSFSKLLDKDITQKIKNKEDQLAEIKQKKEQLREAKKKFLKVYITMYINELYRDDIFKIYDYLEFFKEKEKSDFIKKALIKRILEIEREEKNLDIAYNEILKEIATLKTEKTKLSEIKKKSFSNWLKSQNYTFESKGPAPVLSPVEGVVEKITYRANNFEITIKTKDCMVLISNLDEIKVNVGDRINKNQEIGYISKNKKVSVSNKCRKTF